MTEDQESDKIRAELFSINPKEYGDKYLAHLLEEYKLYVNIMDNTSERRLKANTFFLAINSAIIGLMGLITTISGGTLFINCLWMVLSSVFGILLCLRWDDILKSYIDLSSGRFFIIHMLEERLPAKLYKAEWDYLKPKTGESRYTQMTLTEKRVPSLFKRLYGFLIIVIIISFLCSGEFKHALLTCFPHLNVTK